MNIKNVMMMAAMMPAFALAETNSNCAPVSVEANDTTIRVNDQTSSSSRMVNRLL